MKHILVSACSRNDLERAFLFLESVSHQGIVYHYTFWGSHESENDTFRYAHNISLLIRRGNYDSVLYWGMPERLTPLQNTPYVLLFENVDHILYPVSTSENALRAWWSKRSRDRYVDGAILILSTGEHIREYLAGESPNIAKKQYCLPTILPPIAVEDGFECSESFEVFSPEVVTIVGHDIRHASLQESHDVCEGDISFLSLSSHLNALAQIRLALKSTSENPVPNLVNENEARIRLSRPIHFDQGIILLDLHLTSGVSDTLAYALTIGAPVITLNHNALSQELQDMGYPYVFSLARTTEMKHAISELRSDHQSYTQAQEIIRLLADKYKKHLSRSSVHAHFLLNSLREDECSANIV